MSRRSEQPEEAFPTSRSSEVQPAWQRDGSYLNPLTIHDQGLAARGADGSAGYRLRDLGTRSRSDEHRCGKLDAEQHTAKGRDPSRNPAPMLPIFEDPIGSRITAQKRQSDLPL